jgi:hypothetical protein
MHLLLLSICKILPALHAHAKAAPPALAKRSLRFRLIFMMVVLIVGIIASSPNIEAAQRYRPVQWGLTAASVVGLLSPLSP